MRTLADYPRKGFSITPEMTARAEEIAKKRDSYKLKSTHFAIEKHNLIGALGELVFEECLKSMSVDFETVEVYGKGDDGDFKIQGRKIDVKTHWLHQEPFNSPTSRNRCMVEEKDARKYVEKDFAFVAFVALDPALKTGFVFGLCDARKCGDWKAEFMYERNIHPMHVRAFSLGRLELLPRKCRVCGCTDDKACEGGCSWAKPGLCSNCVWVETAAGGKITSPAFVHQAGVG